MRKMKKFLAAVLAAATVFSMSAMPAFAADDAEVTSLTFKKTFVSESGSNLPNATFEFTMTPTQNIPKDTTYDNLEVVSGLELATSTVSIPYTSETKDIDVDIDGITQSSKFDFILKQTEGQDEVKFVGPKAYSYDIKEVKPTTNVDGSIVYDETVYTVYLIVDGSNKVTAVVNASPLTETETQKGMTKVEQTVTKRPIVFTNTCSTDSLTIEKKVDGSMGDKNRAFKFQLTIPVSGGSDGHTIDAGTTYTGNIEYADGSKSEDITFIVKDNPVYGSEDSTKDENVFSLKDGEKLVIKGLPEKTIYTVEEKFDKDDHDGYSTTITSDVKTRTGESIETISGTLFDANAQNAPIGNNGNTITFTNKKTFTPTGLTLKVGQQLIVLLIAVFGAVVIFKTRRRSSAK